MNQFDETKNEELDYQPYEGAPDEVERAQEDGSQDDDSNPMPDFDEGQAVGGQEMAPVAPAEEGTGQETGPVAPDTIEDRI